MPSERIDNNYRCTGRIITDKLAKPLESNDDE
jgi:hypothetical protein